MERNFWNRGFRFKVRLWPFWIDSNQRNLRPKIFVFAICSTYDPPPFFEKIVMFKEKSHKWDIFFEIKILILRYVLDHSESSPIKKVDQKSLSLPFLRSKVAKFRGFLKIFDRKIKFQKKIVHSFCNFYCRSFEASYTSERLNGAPYWKRWHLFYQILKFTPSFFYQFWKLLGWALDILAFFRNFFCVFLENLR